MQPKNGLFQSAVSDVKLPREMNSELGTDQVPTSQQVLSKDSIVVVSIEQISCDLIGDAVILDLKKGIYYGLDEVGARVWTLIKEPRRVSEILDALIEEYDVDRDRCESDVMDLLRDLQGRELIEIRYEATA